MSPPPTAAKKRPPLPPSLASASTAAAAASPPPAKQPSTDVTAPPNGQALAKAHDGAPPKGKGKAPPPPPPKSSGKAPPPPPPSKAAGGKAPPPPPPSKAAGGKRPPPPPAGKSAAPKVQNEKPKEKSKGIAPIGRRLHWDALMGAKIEGTIFENLVDNEEVSDDYSNLIDIAALKRVFAQEAAPTSRRRSTFVNRDDELTILSGGRAQNVAIVLSRLKSSVPEIVTSLQAMNGDAFDIETLEKLAEAMPTVEELTQFAKFKESGKDFAKLRDIEKRVWPLTELPRGTQRCRVLTIQKKFPARIGEIEEACVAMENARVAVKESKRFRSLLVAVLLWGNFVNHGISPQEELVQQNATAAAAVPEEGGRRRRRAGTMSVQLQTYGFTLSSLIKLSEFKTTVDASITSLHYIIANMIESQPKVQLELLPEELAPVQDASRVTAKAIKENLASLQQDVQFLALEVNNPKSKEVYGDQYETLVTLHATLDEAISKVAENYKETTIRVMEAAKYFGDAKATPESFENFFGTLKQFIKIFEKCIQDYGRSPAKFKAVLVESAENRGLMYIQAPEKSATAAAAPPTEKKTSSSLGAAAAAVAAAPRRGTVTAISGIASESTTTATAGAPSSPAAPEAPPAAPPELPKEPLTAEELRLQQVAAFQRSGRRRASLGIQVQAFAKGVTPPPPRNANNNAGVAERRARRGTVFNVDEIAALAREAAPENAEPAPAMVTNTATAMAEVEAITALDTRLNGNVVTFEKAASGGGGLLRSSTGSSSSEERQLIRRRSSKKRRGSVGERRARLMRAGTGDQGGGMLQPTLADAYTAVPFADDVPAVSDTEVDQRRKRNYILSAEGGEVVSETDSDPETSAMEADRMLEMRSGGDQSILAASARHGSRRFRTMTPTQVLSNVGEAAELFLENESLPEDLFDGDAINEAVELFVSMVSFDLDKVLEAMMTPDCGSEGCETCGGGLAVLDESVR